MVDQSREMSGMVRLPRVHASSLKQTGKDVSEERQLPDILRRETLAETRLFRVEALHLRFSNGAERHYERLKPGRHGAVLVVPVLDAEHFLLVREYAAGTERYELGFPKGLREDGETSLQAANRELMEEAGYGARTLAELKQVTLAPGYLGHRMSIVLARDLFPASLPGDEPEPLEVLPWRFDAIDALLAREDFSEGRSIAALYLARDWLTRQTAAPQDTDEASR